MDFLELLDSNLEIVTPAYMRGIIAPLRSIDPARIDLDRSEIERSQEDSAVIVRVFSLRDLCCPLSIVFGIGDFSRFFYFAYGESDVTFEEMTDDELDAVDSKRLFRRYLETDVTEERTMIGDRLARVSYSYTFKVDARRETFKDTTSKMVIWPWREKKVTLTKYRAWLPAETNDLAPEKRP